MERAWLESHRTDVVKTLQAQRRREQGWSFVRLATFLVAAAGWVPVRAAPLGVWAVVVAGIVAFVVAVIRHLQARYQRILAERHRDLVDEALQRHGGRLVVIRSATPPPTPPDVPEIHAPRRVAQLGEQELDDLDIHAEPVGLYGLLNRTSTDLGAARLQRWIEQVCLDPHDILARQQAVQWLRTHDAQRFALMTACAGLRGQDRHFHAAIDAIDRAQRLPWTPSWIRALQVWSMLTLVGCVGCGVAVMLGNLLIGTIVLAIIQVNALVFLRLRAPLARALKPWQSVRGVLLALQTATERAAAVLPHDAMLGRIHQLCTVAAPVVHHLRRRVGWTDTGGMFYVLCNLTFFYDVHVAASILGVVVPRRDDLMRACGALAELEALCSLACFAAEQPTAAVPEVTEGGPCLRISGGRHPLVDPAAVTPNDAGLDGGQRLWIITGSNMAGKSTYLRMVATELLLAQLGTAVTATAMTWSPMRLLTDLRIRDSVGKEESYFMAEVRQLRRMVVIDPQAPPLLGLIDEPFRGTNSDERVAASIALVGHLRDHGGLFLVATHERAITALADDTVIANYHFSETVAGSATAFDHLLRPGPAQDRNALRIMEREGFPPGLVARARAWLDGNA